MLACRSRHQTEEESYRYISVNLSLLSLRRWMAARFQRKIWFIAFDATFVNAQSSLSPLVCSMQLGTVGDADIARDPCAIHEG